MEDTIKMCLRQLEEAAKNADTENAHRAADAALLQAIEDLTSSKEVTEKFKSIKKWYS